MKKPTILPALAMLMLAISCKKESQECNLTAAKILRYDCDRVILQLQDSPGMGDTDWTDIQTGIRYNNVVYYPNTCRISALTYCEKLTLYVRAELLENPAPQECYQCQAISQSPPGTMVDLLEISLTDCPAQQ
jgi:hypothetical protein